MESTPSPEPHKSIVGRIRSLVEEKRTQVAEKFGNENWKTLKEVVDTHKVFIAGVTLAGGLAAFGHLPGLDNNLVGMAVETVAASTGAMAIGAEVWNMFRLWAIDQKRVLQKANN